MSSLSRATLQVLRPIALCLMCALLSLLLVSAGAAHAQSNSSARQQVSAWMSTAGVTTRIQDSVVAATGGLAFDGTATAPSGLTFDGTKGTDSRAFITGTVSLTGPTWAVAIDVGVHPQPSGSMSVHIASQHGDIAWFGADSASKMLSAFVDSGTTDAVVTEPIDNNWHRVIYTSDGR